MARRINIGAILYNITSSSGNKFSKSTARRRLGSQPESFGLCRELCRQIQIYIDAEGCWAFGGSALPNSFFFLLKISSLDYMNVNGLP